ARPVLAVRGVALQREAQVERLARVDAPFAQQPQVPQRRVLQRLRQVLHRGGAHAAEPRARRRLAEPLEGGALAVLVAALAEPDLRRLDLGAQRAPGRAELFRRGAGQRAQVELRRAEVLALPERDLHARTVARQGQAVVDQI